MQNLSRLDLEFILDVKEIGDFVGHSWLKLSNHVGKILLLTSKITLEVTATRAGEGISCNFSSRASLNGSIHVRRCDGESKKLKWAKQPFSRKNGRLGTVKLKVYSRSHQWINRVSFPSKKCTNDVCSMTASITVRESRTGAQLRSQLSDLIFGPWCFARCCPTSSVFGERFFEYGTYLSVCFVLLYSYHVDVTFKELHLGNNCMHEWKHR